MALSGSHRKSWSRSDDGGGIHEADQESEQANRPRKGHEQGGSEREALCSGHPGRAEECTGEIEKEVLSFER